MGKKRAYYESPIGRILLEEEEEHIVGLNLTKQHFRVNVEETLLLRETKKQLTEYFQGLRKKFSLPIALKGTPFQQKVWEALRTIPYGETCSYKDIAMQIGQPGAMRAVGGANNKNPIMIIVPCHRVIGANKQMIGFGAGIPIKEYLLAHEAKYR
ncbi:methylated-DNA--[protein]-cysteine S-methyltransferase [Anaerosporobacter faecicola]|uniref:methylated-DNA--[protein]-cysteine S-methyltransferase n=1 Tax=Anaerosporobacter faecicola TaxID=2718714 RepID=UPI00143C0763|nr:methylated-DNA--[protein]-cysteine S-methyltransferase [Anaerosporobacter faecicola]